MSQKRMTTAQRREASREEHRRREEAERRRARRGRLAWWGAGIAFLVAVAATVVFTHQTQAAKTIDGIQCNTNESFVSHIHQHLAIYNKGRSVQVPQGIGIKNANPATSCLFWLHTHAANGVIHVESPARDTYTLGQFFAVWGQPLSQTQVTTLTTDAAHQIRAYVNGRPFPGDPRTIPLTQHELITLEYGPPWVPPAQHQFEAGE